jgi:TonB-linked SusC/RagA family outer membrane protein
MNQLLLQFFLPSKKLLLLVLLVYGGFALSAQTIQVKGKVSSQGDGEALPGVNILVKGSLTGTATDADGNYSISVANDAVLSFSFIGYIAKEIPVNNSTVLDVQLVPDVSTLEEVVVVAFATQKKATVTGAVVSVQNKEIRQSPAANLAVSLAGRLPGLTSVQRSGEPGRDLTQLFIRGQGTTNAQSPIVLVDGVERDLTYIDPNEVESITILKDASSTAIFGVRGANGVILVTTRRGASEIPEINFTAEAGLTSFTRIPKPVDAYGFATLRNLSQTNDGIQPAYSPEAVEAFRTGSDPKRYPNTDWSKLLIRDNALQQRYNLNISGAGKAVKYFVNAGLLNQGGQFNTEKGLNYDPSFNLKRYNFRSNIDIQLNQGLKAFLNVAGYLENQNGPFAVGVASTGQGGQSPSYYILAGIFDLPAVFPGPTSPDNGVVTTPTEQNPPFGILNRTGYRQQTRSNVIASYGMEQDLKFITPGLSAKAIISFDSRSVNNLNASKSYVRKLHVVDPTLKDAEGKDSVYYKNFASDVETPLALSGGAASFSSLSNFQAYLNYNRTFGQHALSALLLYQEQKNIIDAQLPFNLVGLSTRVTYGFANKYFAEFNAGYNGSEQFAKNNRFGFFPAISAGWMISNESFFDNVKGIQLLKIRGSYGLVGNDRIGSRRFLYLDDIQVPGGGYSGSLGLGQRVATNLLKNQDLTWEVARKTNIGLEVGFLQSFNLIVDVFTEERTNILRNRGTVPVLNGLPNSVLPPVNLGIVHNSGYEIELNYKKSFSKDFSMLSRLNLSYATNTQKFADEPLLPADYAYRYRQQDYRIGQPFGYLVDKYFDSVDEINQSPKQNVGGHESRPGDFKYKDLNGDNVINEKDQAPIGYSTVPEYTFGAAISATFKNFDLSILFQGVTNVSNFYQSRGTFPGANYFSRHLESWTAEKVANGDPINYPRLTTQASPNHIGNSFFIIDASYLRVKNLELGYNLPVKLVGKIGAKRLRVYANGLNIFTWDRLPTTDFDPEQDTDLAYPVTKIFNFGFNVTF